MDGLVAEPNNLFTLIKPKIFLELLRYFDGGTELSPVLFEFTEPAGTIRVRVRHSSNDAFVVFHGEKEMHEASTSGYIVAEPKEILAEMYRYKDSNFLEITAKDNEQTKFNDELGNWNKFTPTDKSLLKIPNLKMWPDFKDNWYRRRVKENGEYKFDENNKPVYDKAKTRITIDAGELQGASKAMKSSGRNYVEFHFSSEGSWFRAGHKGKGKQDKSSNTMLKAEVEGEDFNITLHSVFTGMVKQLDGKVEVFGTDKIPIMVVTKKLEYGRLTFLFLEPIWE
jgi:hypothetical protein